MIKNTVWESLLVMEASGVKKIALHKDNFDDLMSELELNSPCIPQEYFNVNEDGTEPARSAHEHMNMIDIHTADELL